MAQADEIDNIQESSLRSPSAPPSIASKLKEEVKDDFIEKPTQVMRRASKSFSNAQIPVGVFSAYGHYAAAVPSLGDIQEGKFTAKGWSGPAQRRHSNAHRHTDIHVLTHHYKKKAAENCKKVNTTVVKTDADSASQNAETSVIEIKPHDPSVPYENGYQFPPKHTKTQAFIIGARGFWSYFLTPVGFLVTIYSLNVVAWGGMLFLILCHAAPAMNHPSYDYDYSKAKIWLEIDSQILNALFCVTGLGLIPWRFRDLYYLLQWRWKKNHDGLRHLAGIHRGWFRLEGSERLDVHLHPEEYAEKSLPEGTDQSTLALPLTLSPSAPLTGERAPPSAYWKMDLVVWSFVINSLLQIVLCGFMWGMHRLQRPGWVTGLLISMGCIIAMVGGWYIFKEGSRVKKVEGVPVSAEDMEILRKMRTHELSQAPSTTV